MRSGHRLVVGTNAVVTALLVTGCSTGSTKSGGTSSSAAATATTTTSAAAPESTGAAVGGVPAAIAEAGAVLLSVLVRRTAFGYRLPAIGGNLRASVLAGLPVKRTLITVYALSGALAAIAGVISTARLGASDPSYIGVLFELSAITAVVVGGTPWSGGRVRILGTVAGAVLLQLLETTLVWDNIPDSIARIVEGAIITTAVIIQPAGRRSR